MTFLLTRRLFLGASAVGVALSSTSSWAAKPVSRQIYLPLADGRKVPVWRYAPKGRPRGTILFSHGALSAPWKYELLISPWVEAGYLVLAPLHVDSTDHPERDKFPGFASWKARIEDLRAVAASIKGRSFVAAGHSYGAMCALALGGANPILPQGVVGPLRDPRVRLVLAFSPPGAMPGLIDGAGYSGLDVPALIQTGTKDVPPGAPDWKGHLLAWESPIARGDRYAMVLDGVDHYFGGAICRPELPGPKQTAELAMASTVSLQMLNAFAPRRAVALRKLNASLTETGTSRLLRR